MFSEEYRHSDEYLAFKKVVLEVAPNLPLPLVERAIFMHKHNPRLYRDIEKLEQAQKRENAQREREMARNAKKKKSDNNSNIDVQDDATKDKDTETENASHLPDQ